MSEELAWIDSPTDAELQKAWQALIAQVGLEPGWQYMGSAIRGGTWVHCFRNRRRLEEAETEEDAESARQEVAASEGWCPKPLTH